MKCSPHMPLPTIPLCMHTHTFYQKKIDTNHKPHPPFPFSHSLCTTFTYNNTAANPARTAPALTNVVAAPPGKGFEVRVGDTGELVFELPLPLGMVALPVARVKLAHVRRVLSLVWITMERLPKKELGPLAVER